MPRGPQDRPHQQKSTVKSKFVPRGPKDRLHQRRALQNKSALRSRTTTSPTQEHPTEGKQEQIRASGSTRSTPPKEEHCKNKFTPRRSTRSTSLNESTHKRRARTLKDKRPKLNFITNKIRTSNKVYKKQEKQKKKQKKTQNTLHGHPPLPQHPPIRKPRKPGPISNQQ